jgi:cyclophilin family peptidyl-prolyl cis-trans isomerase
MPDCFLTVLRLGFVFLTVSMPFERAVSAQEEAQEVEAAVESNAELDGVAKEKDAKTEQTSPESEDVPDSPDEKPITPEQQVAIDAYVKAQREWADALIEMKAASIEHSNSEGRSLDSKERYKTSRDVARTKMNDAFQRALELFRSRPGDFDSGSLMTTMLEYREQNSIYENSFEAAELLLEHDLTFPFLYQIAARSAFLEGKFDRMMKYYQAFVDLNGAEKLERVDNMLVGLQEVYKPLWDREQELREQEAKADDLPRVKLETSRGPVVLELFENQAPNTVANFIQLVEDGFYDGADFYQVVDDFLAMGGDPVGDGTGTSGKYIPDEHEHPDARKFFRGSLVMAKAPNPTDTSKLLPNSASSQFAIALMPLIRDVETQTVFGRVIEGLDVVCTFRRIDPSEKKEKKVQLPPDRIITATVIRKRDHDYKVEYVQP